MTQLWKDLSRKLKRITEQAKRVYSPDGPEVQLGVISARDLSK